MAEWILQFLTTFVSNFYFHLWIIDNRSERKKRFFKCVRSSKWIKIRHHIQKIKYIKIKFQLLLYILACQVDLFFDINVSFNIEWNVCYHSMSSMSLFSTFLFKIFSNFIYSSFFFLLNDKKFNKIQLFVSIFFYQLAMPAAHTTYKNIKGI